MKRFFIILITILLPVIASAQDYEEYLEAAQKHIQSGDLVKAQICYEVYVRKTNKKDPTIEAIIYGSNKEPVETNTVTIHYDNGKYVGHMVDGKRHGQGTYYWKEGDRYEGEWKDDQLTGQGTFYWKNGDKYVGAFVNGKLHGQGTYYWKDGDRYEGEWKEGQKISGTHYYANGLVSNGDMTNVVVHGDNSGAVVVGNNVVVVKKYKRQNSPNL